VVVTALIPVHVPGQGTLLIILVEKVNKLIFAKKNFDQLSSTTGRKKILILSVLVFILFIFFNTSLVLILIHFLYKFSLVLIHR